MHNICTKIIGIAVALTNFVVISYEVQNPTKEPTYNAPDGMHVWNGLQVKNASHAIFVLNSNSTTNAVYHRTVDEIWYCIDGAGEIWIKDSNKEEIVKFSKGTTITIPKGTKFQLKNTSSSKIVISGITSPPWPGNEDEAIQAQGIWNATINSGKGHS